MRKRSLVPVVSLAAAVSGAGALGVVVAIASGGGSPATPPVASVGPGPERGARALGLTGTSPQAVFTLQDGDAVGILRGSHDRCLERTHEGRPAGEVCAADAGLSSGEGISVSDECGTASDHEMEIIGLAPEGTSEVRLRYSDGSAASAPVQQGAFKFEGRNPASGERYPQGVEWLSAGTAVGGAGLPVRNAEFCLPAG
jgi:hypothetical protein